MSYISLEEEHYYKKIQNPVQFIIHLAKTAK